MAAASRGLPRRGQAARLRQPGEETIDPLQCLWLRTEHHPQFTVAATHHARRHRTAGIRQFNLNLRAGWHGPVTGQRRAAARDVPQRHAGRRTALGLDVGHGAIGGDTFVTPAFIGGVVAHRDQELVDFGAQRLCLAADLSRSPTGRRGWQCRRYPRPGPHAPWPERYRPWRWTPPARWRRSHASWRSAVPPRRRWPADTSLILPMMPPISAIAVTASLVAYEPCRSGCRFPRWPWRSVPPAPSPRPPPPQSPCRPPLRVPLRSLRSVPAGWSGWQCPG